MGINIGDVSPQIEGATDGTLIGNVSDRLKVDITRSTPNYTFPTWRHTLRYIDMNVASGGIARLTSLSGGTWTTIFSYSGSGYIAGCVVNTDTFADWEFRLTVDSQVIFSLASNDIATDAIYDLDDVTDSNQGYLGVSNGNHDKLLWHPPLNYPLYYSSSVLFEIRKNGAAKNFQAGLMIMSKET